MAGERPPVETRQGFRATRAVTSTRPRTSSLGRASASSGNQVIHLSGRDEKQRRGLAPMESITATDVPVLDTTLHYVLT